ncbi:MAG: helix-turn-helix domain-containing protein [Chloroflexota bacterium]
MSNQLELLQKWQKINQDLTKLMLQNGNLSDLVQLLAQLLQRSVCIEDTAYYIIADAEVGAVDKARRQSVHLGRTSAQLTQQLIEHGVYRSVAKAHAPVYYPPLPNFEMTRGRIIAPIRIDQTLHGYLWIIADEPLTDALEKIVIEQGITAVALIMLKENAAREARNSLSGDFFANLLREKEDRQRLIRQARQLNYQLEQPRQALLIHGVPHDSGSQQSFAQAVDNWLAEQQYTSLKLWHNNRFVLLFVSQETAVGLAAAQQLLRDLRHPVWKLLVGVGQAYVEATPRHVRQSYREAQEALEIGLRQGRQTGVVSFQQLGLLHWLYHLSPENRKNNLYIQLLAEVSAYDAQHKSELLKTLGAFLENGYSLAEAARRLHVHRNTLIKRLKRVEVICGVDLGETAVLLNLHVAFLSLRLHNKNHEQMI